MAFSYAAALRAAARSCVIAARAVAGVSGCSRGAQAFRAGRFPALASKSRFRAPAAARRTLERRGLYVLSGPAAGRRAASRDARVAQAFGPSGGAQPPEALYPGSIPVVPGELRRRGSAGPSPFRSESIPRHGYAPAEAVGPAVLLSRRCLVALVRGYQFFIAPLLPVACRFHPSCSEYAKEALERHGVLRGGWLCAHRLCRCAPWHAGGHDPVP
jgi:uncharacterized protein